MIFDKEHRNFSGLFIFFGLFSLVFWWFFYPNHLIHREQTQMFLWGTNSLLLHLKQQGGLAIYLGEFITQFFYFPFLGALFMTLVQLSLALSVRRLFRLMSQAPIFDSFAFLPVIGYSLLMFDSFYLISGMIAFIIALQLAVALLQFQSSSQSLYWGIVWLPLVYWMTGGTYILYGMIWLLALAFDLPKVYGKTRYTFSERLFGSLGIVLLMATVPLIAQHLFLFDTSLQSYFSEAFYKIRIQVPTQLILIAVSILILMIVVVVIASLVDRRRTFKWLQRILIVVVVGFLTLGTIFEAHFDEEQELKYDRWVTHQQWDKIIRHAEKAETLGTNGRLALSMALAETGQLTRRMFELGLKSDDMLLIYDMKGMAPMIASEPYYELGLINFAQMLAMESIESTPDARMPVRSVKRVAETYLINGQYGVAEKFLLHLKKTLFYRHWAKQALAALGNEELINNHPVWGHKRAIQPKTDFFYQGADSKISLLYLLNGNMNNPMAYEYLMARFLYELDFDSFMKNLAYYPQYHYPETPLAFQEAIAYIETLTEEIPAEVKQIPVNDEVRARLKAYAARYMNGGSKQPEKMNAEFGKTFWYYLHFEAHE